MYTVHKYRNKLFNFPSYNAYDLNLCLQLKLSAQLILTRYEFFVFYFFLLLILLVFLQQKKKKKQHLFRTHGSCSLFSSYIKLIENMDLKWKTRGAFHWSFNWWRKNIIVFIRIHTSNAAAAARVTNTDQITFCICVCFNGDNKNAKKL